MAGNPQVTRGRPWGRPIVCDRSGVLVRQPWGIGLPPGWRFRAP
jgi:hypothetical protein